MKDLQVGSEGYKIREREFPKFLAKLQAGADYNSLVLPIYGAIDTARHERSQLPPGPTSKAETNQFNKQITFHRHIHIALE